MLQPAYDRKPDGLSLNFAIDKVWGQGEEGPPGSKLRFSRGENVSAVPLFSLTGTVFESTQPWTSESIPSAKRPKMNHSGAPARKLWLAEIEPKHNSDLPCTRKTLQQCRSTSNKSGASTQTIHSKRTKRHLIGIDKRGS